MPDGEGRLSPAEISHIRNWVTSRGGGQMPLCPVSQDRAWFVTDTVLQSLVYPTSSTRFFPELPYPYVQMLCTTCGYVMSFSAALMGLFPVTKDVTE